MSYILSYFGTDPVLCLAVMTVAAAEVKLGKAVVVAVVVAMVTMVAVVTAVTAIPPVYS